MKVLLCPDKFKGSLSASEICQALSEGLLNSGSKFEISSHPMADGGDGSIDVLQSYLQLIPQKLQTIDPLGRMIEAEYYYSQDTAFIEMASASGLVLLEESERNPMLTSTKGTGIMVRHAIKSGFKKIYLFIGGSATNDAGIGIAQALGFSFLDDQSHELDPIGKNLNKIKSIRNDTIFDFSNIAINVLCDVSNPMHGPNGAAYVYASQKGALDNELGVLDDGLKNYAEVLKSIIGKDVSQISGIGAAGAVGASLVGLLGAQLMNGFKMISDITGLETGIKQADLVITGEGKIDRSSFQGKVVGNVIELSERHSTPCGIIAGIIEDLGEQDSKLVYQKSVVSLARDLHDAMHNTQKYLQQMGEELGRISKISLGDP